MYIICEETERGVRVFDTKDGVNEGITYEQFAYLKSIGVRFKKDYEYNYGTDLYRYLLAQTMWGMVKTLNPDDILTLNRTSNIMKIMTDSVVSKRILDSVRRMMELDVKTFPRDWVKIYEYSYNVFTIRGTNAFIVPMAYDGLMFIIEQGIFFAKFTPKLLSLSRMKSKKGAPDIYLYLDEGMNVVVKTAYWSTGWNFYGKLLYEGYFYED